MTFAARSIAALGLAAGFVSSQASAQSSRSPARLVRADSVTDAVLQQRGWRAAVRGREWIAVVPAARGAATTLRVSADGRVSRDAAAKDEDQWRQWSVLPSDGWPTLADATTASRDSHTTAPAWKPPWIVSPLDSPRGVVVGIVDTGALLEHEAFLDSLGGSRVAYYWSQAATSGGERTPADLGYGRECEPRARGLASCGGIASDWNGHGTHVASIAAGSSSDSTYRGVAPGATLVIVALPDAASPADIVLGVYYVFQRARMLGLPAVVNVSFGSQNGPHDGADLIARLIEPLLGPGRIMVGSAGNNGKNASLVLATPTAVLPASMHSESMPAGSAPYEARWTVRSAQPPTEVSPSEPLARVDSTDAMLVETWLPPVAGAANDSTPRVTLTVAGSVVIDLMPDTVAARQVDTLFGASVTVTADHGWAFGGDSTRWRIAVFIEGTDVQPRLVLPEDWRVSILPRTRPAAPSETWIAFQRFDRGRREGATLQFGVNRHLVSSPSSGRRMISVAAYANAPRLATSSPAPSECSRCSPLGDLTWFSSPGPRTDGHLKPDLAGPGDLIAGARAPGSLLIGDDSVSRARWAVNPAYGYLRGTSQAAPQMAGLLAHALAGYPMMTPEEARAVLTRSTIKDAFTSRSYSEGDPNDGRNPNASWGAGKASPTAALATVRTSRSSRLAITPEQNPIRGEQSVRFRLDGGNASDLPKSLHVYDMMGGRVTSRAVGIQTASRDFTWDLKSDAGVAVSSGIYLVRIETRSGATADFRLVVVRP